MRILHKVDTNLNSYGLHNGKNVLSNTFFVTYNRSSIFHFMESNQNTKKIPIENFLLVADFKQLETKIFKYHPSFLVGVEFTEKE